MTRLGDEIRWFAGAVFRRRALDAEIARELSYHYDRQVAENLAAGMDAAEAARQARLSIGGLEQVGDACRTERGVGVLDEVPRDVRGAFRALARAPGFTTVAMLSLALAIGANATIFSVLNALVLKTLPVADPGGLVRVVRVAATTGVDATRFDYPSFREFSREARSFSSMLAWAEQPATLVSGVTAERVRVEIVSGTYFRTLCVHAALGRVLEIEDDGPEGAGAVCVISHRLWQTRFSGDPNILGRQLLLNHHPFQVIGVTEGGFHGASLNSRADLQVPMSMAEQFLGNARDDPGWTWLAIMGRLRTDRDRARAEAEVQAIGRRLDAENVTQGSWGRDDPYRLRPAPQGFDERRDRDRLVRPASLLMAGVAVLLVVACVNLAGLQLARALVRAREVAIRLSLGAARARIVRELLTESLVLSALGGVAGFALSLAFTRALAGYLGGADFGLVLRLEPDVRVAAFTLGVSVTAGFLFGLTPALRATRLDAVGGLRAASAGVASSGLRRSLVVGQVTLSVVLLFGAGLLQRSLFALKAVDLGFRPERVVAATLSPDASGYDESGADAFATAVLTRVRAIACVRSASVSYVGTLSGKMFAAFVQVPGRRRDNDLNDRFNIVSPGYFRTLGIPIVAGRDFTDADRRRESRVAVVSRRFAQHYWPGVDPIGRRFKTMGGETEVVGLVGDAKYQSVREDAPRTVYVPMKPGWAGEFTLQARVDGEAAGAIGLVRGAVRATDARVVPFDVTTVEARRDALIATDRALGLVSELFGGAALLLCAIGLYGLVAYSVSSRRKEVGIRLAVGAGTARVVWLFLREAVALAGLGLAVGAPAALLAARPLKGTLFGLPASDGATLSAAMLVLFVTAVLAAWLPARRAAQLDPVTALRVD